jgi:hypothetical protein
MAEIATIHDSACFSPRQTKESRNPLLLLAALLAALASFFLGRQVEIFRDLKRRLHSITSHDKTPISAIYPAAEAVCLVRM